jgi:phage/plasmid-like protein (TIGR03299 family)
MAHQIHINTTGTASYASTQREWHGLGQLMLPGQSIEKWQEEAGMNYEVQRGYVRYATERGQSADAMKVVKDKVVLFRSDTKDALGVVSDSYKVVQPREVLEFFRDWATAGGMTIESAGVLFGGKRYFATAKMAAGVCVDGYSDRIVPYALLSTSADGSLATEARWTTVRVVCNNTLSMAREGKAAVRVTHRSEFKPEEVQSVLENANAEFHAFMEMSRQLAGIKVARPLAEDLTMHLFKTGTTKDADKVKESRGFIRVMELFNGAAKGATLETAQETAWGWLNAVTEYADHHIRAHSDENRTASALWGQGDTLKNRAVELALAAA